MRVLVPVLLALLAACGESSLSSELTLERPLPVPFAATVVRAQVELASGSGFADQTGGGVFVTPTGQAVRLRLDGTRAQLESYPGNRVVPGAARAAFRMGPRSALVETESGLFVADGGWLIELPWRDALGPGLVATAQALDGSTWLAHTSGLFRLYDGKLAALKVNGEALDGITALAAATAEDGAPGLWMLRGGSLSVAVSVTPQSYEVRPAFVPLEEQETVVTLAALGPSKERNGELWVLTSKRLLRRKGGDWRKVEFSQRPVQLLAAGRFLWVKSSDQVFFYDADADTWGVATGVDTREFRFLVADESGCAWVQLGAEAAAIHRAPTPRVSGLYQGMQLVLDGLVVRAVPPPGPAPASVVFQLEGASIKVEPPAYSLGGVEADGTPRPFSFAGLEPGLHELSVVARFLDGSEARRVVPFDYRPFSTVAVGWEKDIRPIYEARCARCHLSGPGRQLSTYELWKANAALITAAVRDQRMPADGPLDPQFISLIQRWASSGAKP